MQPQTIRLDPSLLRAASLALLAALFGACAPDADDAALDPALQLARTSPPDAGARADAGAPWSLDGGAPARLPRIAEVKALGDGCPSGATHVFLAPDGNRLKVSFSALVADKLGEQTVASRQCRLDIRLTADEAFSPTLVDASLEAFMLLQTGVEGAMSLRAAWDGDERAVPATTSVRSPADAWHVVGHGETSATTAACAKEHVLTLEARLTIRDGAGASGGRGYINAAAAVPQAGIETVLDMQRCR